MPKLALTLTMKGGSTHDCAVNLADDADGAEQAAEMAKLLAKSDTFWMQTGEDTGQAVFIRCNEIVFASIVPVA